MNLDRIISWFVNINEAIESLEIGGPSNLKLSLNFKQCEIKYLSNKSRFNVKTLISRKKSKDMASPLPTVKIFKSF